MNLLTVFLISSSGLIGCFGLRRVYPSYKTFPTYGDVGEPLFLTPFIESGKIQEGQDAAKVKLEGTNVNSFAGYLTVNKTYNSNLYFWFFPAELYPDNAPVVLWLQGGPGASSMFGLFCEHGPFFVTKDGKLESRKYSWSNMFNMIYIDNPVGTGFSFTEDTRGYANDEIDVGRDLYEALSQFFRLFPKLQKNDFFATGESYGGKYVPAISYTIHVNNKKNVSRINLKGLAIGNGWTAPEYMLNYGDYLYQIGLIDTIDREVFLKAQSEALKCIHEGDYSRANKIMDELIDGDSVPLKSFFYNITGFEMYFNYLHNKDYSTYGDLGQYLQSDSVRRSIHVGNMTFQDGAICAKHLFNDTMQSVKPWIEVLMDNYRVLFYNGQLDIICSYPLTVNVVRHLNWSGADLYKTASRQLWLVDGELAGYSKSVKDFTEVLVRNAGHMVPNDQPKWALDLITRFVFNKPFYRESHVIFF